MQSILPTTLDDIPSRISYLQSFLSFDPAVDGPAIQASKPLIAPLLPAILDAVYTHLISYDITAKAFVAAQPESESKRESLSSPPVSSTSASLQDLTLDHPHVKHRKDFLHGYLVKLVSNSDWTPTSAFWTYLDRVGLMHTGRPGFRHRERKVANGEAELIRVEYMHAAALLAFVEDVVIKTAMEADGLDAPTKLAVVRAFNKLLWIQNDLFARHYVWDRDVGSLPVGLAA